MSTDFEKMVAACGDEICEPETWAQNSDQTWNITIAKIIRSHFEPLSKELAAAKDYSDRWPGGMEDDYQAMQEDNERLRKLHLASDSDMLSGLMETEAAYMNEKLAVATAREEIKRKDATIRAMANYIKDVRSYNAACSYRTVDEIIADYTKEDTQ